MRDPKYDDGDVVTGLAGLEGEDVVDDRIGRGGSGVGSTTAKGGGLLEINLARPGSGSPP
jgi:hypothetical protein